MSSRKIQIAASLLAADLSRLGEAARAAQEGGADEISVDVMDGRFVPNLSFGPDHVRMAKREASLPVDAHLMVVNPEEAVPWFLDAGADIVIVHLEACRDPLPLLKLIRAGGARAGLAIKPATPAQALFKFLDFMDLALVMTVEPGFGGSSFLDSMLPKVRALRGEIDRGRHRCLLQVDGGINQETAPLAVAAGAESLVAGSAVFHTGNAVEAVRALREAAEEKTT